MPNIVIVGAQWGDEGKGKIIDLLAEGADYIVRYQGGNNAGHTVVVGDEEFVLHLVPSGILREGKICVIGNGVVVDPKAFLDEVEGLRKRGVKIDDNLLVDEEAHIIFPYHRILDNLREEKKGLKKLGTTRRGIGPCYADKAARIGVRLCELLDEEHFARKLATALEEKNEIFSKVYNFKGFSFNEVYAEYLEYGRKLAQYACSGSCVLNDAISNGKAILFEGAQGTLLDVDHGTYPYVTSSNATAGGACVGTGVGPTKIDKIVGVFKAYTTRVGEGPFPTEFPPSLMEEFQRKGKEFGATTGRPRRCGWFDAVIARHSVRINGLDEMVVTKLDVLDDSDPIKVCTAYKYKGEIYKDLPANVEVLNGVEPIYEELPGWRQDTSGVTKYGDLPISARKYLERISSLLQAKISIISVGSKRSQTIFC